MARKCCCRPTSNRRADKTHSKTLPCVDNVILSTAAAAAENAPTELRLLSAYYIILHWRISIIDKVKTV